MCIRDSRADVADTEHLAAHVTAAKLGLPERVRQDRDISPSRRHVFVGGEEATENRAGVEELEERRADRTHPPLPRALAVAHGDIPLRERRKLAERARPAPEVEIAGVRGGLGGAYRAAVVRLPVNAPN